MLLLPLLPAFLLTSAHAQTVDAGSRNLKLHGPLPMRDYDPASALFLLPTPIQASTLARGKASLDVNVDLVNNFLILPQVGLYEDFEDQRYTFGYTRGIGSGQELAVRIPYIERNGGILDGLVKGFHTTFGQYGGGRQNYPSNQTHFDLRDAESGGVISQSTSPTSGLGDIVLEYRRSFTNGEAGFDASGAPDPRRVSLTGRALLKLPTGSAHNVLGSGGTDFGIGLAATARPFRRVAFHANVTSTWFSKSEIDALRNRGNTIQSMVAVEWLMDGRTSFVLQSEDSQAPHQTGDAYSDRPRRMFSFGFWHQITPRQSLYLSAGENDFGVVAKTAPDFTLSLGTRLGL